MSTHPLNVPLRVIVGSLTVNADSFVGQAGRRYCHHCSLILADDTVIKGQICTESAEFTSFKENDKIEITLTSHKASSTAAPYSFKFLGLVSTAETLKSKPVMAALQNNPIVRGTVADCALHHSIALHSVGKKVLDINVVINTAYIFQDYFNNALKEKDPE